MNCKDLIGKRINGLFQSEAKEGKLEGAKVQIELEANTFISFPKSLDEELTKEGKAKGAKSIFQQQDTSQSNSISALLGKNKKMLKALEKLNYSQNSSQERNNYSHLEGQKITKILFSEEFWGKIALELENGEVIFTVDWAPKGSNVVGFHHFSSLALFYESYGEEFEIIK